MRMYFHYNFWHWLLITSMVFMLLGCDRTGHQRELTPLDGEAITLNNRAVGLMGRFEYGAALQIFDELTEEYPQQLVFAVNRSIARMNRQLEGDEAQALSRFHALATDYPDDLHVRYCTALLEFRRGELERASEHLQVVLEQDPDDAYAAYFLAQSYQQRGEPAAAQDWYRRVVEADPYLRSAYYALAQGYRQLGKPEEARRHIALYQRLADNPRAQLVEFKYTRMGPRCEARTVGADNTAVQQRPGGPLFGEPGKQLSVLPPAGGEAPIPNLTVVDIDADGQLDLFLAGRGGEPGTHNAVLLGQADGTFAVAANHPLARVPGVNTALWGDYDNDGHTDVYLCRRGPNQLWRHSADGGWQDVTAATGTDNGELDTVDGALFDADHDGDLDLFLVNRDGPDELLNNNLDGSFRPLAVERGLDGGASASRQVLLLDLDNDRDTDIITLKATPPHAVYLNELGWEYTPLSEAGSFLNTPMQALVSGDTDADGLPELYALDNKGSVLRWQPMAGAPWTHTIIGPVSPANQPRLALQDLDGDGRGELLLGNSKTLEVHTLQGDTLAPLYALPAAQDVLAWTAVAIDVGRGPALATLQADHALHIAPAGAGRYAFIGLAPTGQDDNAATMRSNASGIGTRLALRRGGQWILTDNWRRHSGPGQGLQPVVTGLGGAGQLDFVSLTWSDGVFQTELDLAAGEVHQIVETERQLSSCPVLFAWDGERYAFVSDLLGVGGLGYFIEPGVTAPPRPHENFLLPAGLLQARNGRFEVKIGEPMEEVAYLDAVRLVAYDLPPGWDLVLDERMAISGPEVTGAVHYFKTEQLPQRATSADGRDVTAQVLTADLRAAPVGELDRRFIGRLASEQILTLEFARVIDTGAPVLMIDGWVEYPYSQTMFAAWQARADWQAPTLEARGSDGQWQVVLPEFGYPAGMPRRMSVPLSGLPDGTRTLRLRTNQEIYWDRIAVVHAEELPQARRRELSLLTAEVAESGFARRTTGPQRQPHYDYDRRSPFWDTRHMAGWYTAPGPAKELLADVDDATAIIGPGEEVHLEFDAQLPPLATAWTRRFVLESNGWAKDMDLYTAHGTTVEPLPSSGRSEEVPTVLHARYNTRYRGGH